MTPDSSLVVAPDSASTFDSTAVSVGVPADTAAASEARPLALRGHGRPNPLTASVRALSHAAADAVYLVTTPLRTDVQNLVVTGSVVGAGVALAAADEPVYDGFQRSREAPLYRAVVIDVGGFFEPLGLVSVTTGWLMGAAAAGWLLDVPLLRTIPVEILESNSIVTPIRQPIERTAGRLRPSDSATADAWRRGGDSFPSGHASVTCEAAAILSHHFRHPLARAAIWGVTGATLLQRVDEPGHNHWPSDVWFGAALGAWAGHTFAKRNEERRRGERQAPWYDVLHRPSHDSPEWSVVPAVLPGGGAVTASVRF